MVFNGLWLILEHFHMLRALPDLGYTFTSVLMCFATFQYVHIRSVRTCMTFLQVLWSVEHETIRNPFKIWVPQACQRAARWGFGPNFKHFHMLRELPDLGYTFTSVVMCFATFQYVDIRSVHTCIRYLQLL